MGLISDRVPLYSFGGRRRLAEAFGVSDPNRPSAFDRSSVESFSSEAIEFAQKNPQIVLSIETTLEKFVTGNAQPRHSLRPMSKVRKRKEKTTESLLLTYFSYIHLNSRFFFVIVIDIITVFFGANPTVLYPHLPGYRCNER